MRLALLSDIHGNPIALDAVLADTSAQGGVSLLPTKDRRASYALLEAGASGYHLYLRRVAYDWEEAIAALERARHPSKEYIIRHLRG
jgi:hypothetical protein